MSEAVIVAALGFAGTLTGAYLANRKTSALIAYRLEQLEKKVDKHNSLVERMVKVEESAKSAHHRLDEHFEELEALKNERAS